jgi:hypothetical protein
MIWEMAIEPLRIALRSSTAFGKIYLPAAELYAQPNSKLQTFDCQDT